MENIWIYKEKVTKAYPGDKWSKKVSKMSDNQVIAVYQRLLLSGKIK